MLRYPGGKIRLMKKINNMILDFYPESLMSEWVIAEPFVGGGGSLINMAENFPAWTFHINDTNKEVTSFWKFFKASNDSNFNLLYEKIRNQKVTLSTYKEIFNSKPTTDLDRTFKIIFLNKTSFNGYITECLPIGGQAQESKWNVDVYWKNPENIVRKIKKTRRILLGRILSVSTSDYETFLNKIPEVDFIYADPPYIANGKKWYKCSFDINDLKHLRESLQDKKRWCVSIDKREDTKSIFENCNILTVDIKYQSQSVSMSKRVEKTIPITSELVIFPKKELT